MLNRHVRFSQTATFCTAITFGVLIASLPAPAHAFNVGNRSMLSMSRAAILAERWKTRPTENGRDPEAVDVPRPALVLVLLPGAPAAPEPGLCGPEYPLAPPPPKTALNEAPQPSRGVSSSDNQRLQRLRLLAALCWAIGRLATPARENELPSLTQVRWFQCLDRPDEHDDVLNQSPQNPRSLATELWQHIAHEHYPRAIGVEWKDPALRIHYRVFFYFAYEPPLVPGRGAYVSHYYLHLIDTIHPDLVLGPTSTDQAKALQDAMVAPLRALAAIPPVLTATATATFLTRNHATGRPDGYPFFYRFITPDFRLVNALADELAFGIKPRSITVFCQNGSAYADGLFSDLEEALRLRHYSPPPTRVGYYSPIRSVPHVATPTEPGDDHSHTHPAARTPAAARTANTTPAATAEEAELDPGIRTALSAVASQNTEAVGLFGEIRDKMALLPLIVRHQGEKFAFKTKTIFTTDWDQDLANEDAPDFIVARIHSAFTPTDQSDWDLSTEFIRRSSYDPSAGTVYPDLSPDDYFFQFSRAVQFVIALVGRSELTGSPIRDVIAEHRSGALSRKTERADPAIEFEPNGDLTTAAGKGELILIRHRDVQSLAPFRARSPAALMHSEHQLNWFIWILVLGLSYIAGSNAVAYLRGRTQFKEDPQSSAAAAEAASNQLEKAAIDAGLRRFWYQDWFEVPGWPSWPVWLRYQVPWWLLFGVLVAAADWEGSESVVIWPNGHSVLPTMLIRFSLAGLCLWWLTKWRLMIGNAWRSVGNWGTCGGETLPGRIRRVSSQRARQGLWWAAGLSAVMFGWELFLVRPPITGTVTLWFYLVLSLLSNTAFFYFFFMLLAVRSLSSLLAEGFPENQPIERVDAEFRVLVEPFADTTIVATGIYAGMIIARGTWFDSWVWSPLVILVYVGILAWIIWQQYMIHVAWRDRMVEEKRAYLVALGPGNLSEEEKSRLRGLRGVGDWPWEPSVVVRPLLAILIPLVALTFQSGVGSTIVESVLNALQKGH